MLIAITEHNSWENERWTYVLDLNKQDGGTVNNLMIFVRLANEHWQIADEDTPTPDRSSIFTRHTPKLFAASKYWIKFYDSMERDGNRIKLKNKNGVGLSIDSKNGYKSNRFDLSLVISPKKMLSALISMRDKDTNSLYKNFDIVFLSKKSTPANAASKTKKVI
jgi:hypothetical protein